MHSPVAGLVRNYPIRSVNVIAHIRKATKGAVGLENTHPFMRETVGALLDLRPQRHPERFRAAAEGRYRRFRWVRTDSELAFCCILETLRGCFPAGMPPLPELVELLRALTASWRRHGTFNYLLSNGEYLFAYCADRLSYVVRQAPFTTAHLWMKTWRWTSARSPHPMIG